MLQRMVVKSSPVDEALESVREAERKLTEAKDAERVEQVHEAAATAFAATLQEILGDRPVETEAARRAALQAAAELVWEDTLGPLLTGQQARELLGGVSRQRLDQLVKAGRVIMLEERSGARRFPAWQFRNGRVLDALVAAYRHFIEVGESAWAGAAWCVNSHPQLDGQSPIEWAVRNGAADRLALVAKRDASRLAH
jgi:hypothetical protein